MYFFMAMFITVVIAKVIGCTLMFLGTICCELGGVFKEWRHRLWQQKEPQKQ